MFRMILKFIVYGLILYAFDAIGLINNLGIKQVLLLSAVLAGVNTLIRPILVTLALPFNLITFGLASVFANLLAVVIANAICGSVIHGFWVLLLFAFIVMLADDCLRVSRIRRCQSPAGGNYA